MIKRYLIFKYLANKKVLVKFTIKSNGPKKSLRYIFIIINQVYFDKIRYNQSELIFVIWTPSKTKKMFYINYYKLKNNNNFGFVISRNLMSTTLCIE